MSAEFTRSGRVELAAAALALAVSISRRSSGSNFSMIGRRPQARRRPAARRSWDDMLGLLLEISSTRRFRESSILGTQPEFAGPPGRSCLWPDALARGSIGTRPWDLTKSIRLAEISQERFPAPLILAERAESANWQDGRPGSAPAHITVRRILGDQGSRNWRRGKCAARRARARV
jgi:hypothetical protein